jgi:hypothetical protein
MTNNVGSIDRLIRFLLSSALFYLGLFPFSNSPLGTGLVIAGTVALATGLMGFCALYRILGISTNHGSAQL